MFSKYFAAISVASFVYIYTKVVGHQTSFLDFANLRCNLRQQRATYSDELYLGYYLLYIISAMLNKVFPSILLISSLNV